MKKTIFISILSGIEAKNILRTDILSRLLKEKNLSIVLFLKSADRLPYYRSVCGENAERLQFVVADTLVMGFLEKTLEKLKHYFVFTKTQRLYKQLAYLESKDFLLYAFSYVLSFLLSWSLPRMLSRFVDTYLVKNTTFSSVFDKFRPELVFLGNLFDPIEIVLLREAKRRGVCSIGFINSWDKITSKGFVRILPYSLIVPNYLVRDEACRYLSIPTKRIFVSGYPHYDYYFPIAMDVIPRAEFMRKKGLDPRNKLIVLAPAGSSFTGSDERAVNLLKGIVKKYFDKQVSILVRFQPNDSFNAKTDNGIDGDIAYDVPGARFSTKRGMDWDMDAHDLHVLKNTLYHADLFVTVGSSIGIDAAIFDKPVVVIGFELCPQNSVLEQASLRLTVAHFERVFRIGMKVAHSENELIDLIQFYLKHPEADRKDREEMVKEQCYEVDGKSSERFANFILENIR